MQRVEWKRLVYFFMSFELHRLYPFSSYSCRFPQKHKEWSEMGLALCAYFCVYMSFLGFYKFPLSMSTHFGSFDSLLFRVLRHNCRDILPDRESQYIILFLFLFDLRCFTFFPSSVLSSFFPLLSTCFFYVNELFSFWFGPIFHFMQRIFMRFARKTENKESNETKSYRVQQKKPLSIWYQLNTVLWVSVQSLQCALCRLHSRHCVSKWGSLGHICHDWHYFVSVAGASKRANVFFSFRLAFVVSVAVCFAWCRLQKNTMSIPLRISTIWIDWILTASITYAARTQWFIRYSGCNSKVYGWMLPVCFLVFLFCQCVLEEQQQHTTKHNTITAMLSFLRGPFFPECIVNCKFCRVKSSVYFCAQFHVAENPKIIWALAVQSK